MKRLVIIGGGFAGVKIARELEKKFETVLIDEKDFFEFTPGILRALINPKHLKKIQVRHKNYLKKTYLIKDSVVKIKDKKIFLKNSGEIEFDYLVIATGSKYNSPIKEKNIVIADRGKKLGEYHEKLKDVKNVIIVGGGIVGVEIAGEIVSKYKNKNITLIHNKGKLMERNHPESRKIARLFLEKNKVRIIFHRKVMKYEEKILETNLKDRFLYDLAILCTGITPNSEFLDDEFLDGKNFVRVNDFLQIKGKEKIFVCGDVASIPEEKTAQNAEKHAKIVCHNILSLENKKPLKKYISKKNTILISLGKFYGIFEKNNFVMKGKIPALLKWFVEKKTMLKINTINLKN